ncbi:MAG: DUF1439 domain-containing protein [Saccharospirillaceae bacterium]|nr:DUF1439 domain-containing protein [Pseudomonadales bacterium]NRB78528.1 DUF1439 domain-containing protein [Saccharospirillaceae bacterium]
MRFITLFILISIFSLNVNADPYMLTIEKKILQTQIDKSMPIEKSNFIGKALIDNPKLELNGQLNKIEFWVNFDALILKKINAVGVSKISANLFYNHQEGAFYLHDPIVEALNIKKVKDKHIPIYKKLLQVILKSSFKKHPIYVFDEQDFHQKFAKASLKSVAIVDDALVVVMDLGL